MVVRLTETRDFGLATGWSEEDGTTTTYRSYARRVHTPAPHAMQQRALAPEVRRTPALPDGYAYGSRTDAAAPALDELDLRNNPFARRRGGASTSLWNVLGFAGLFTSVLIGRVIVQGGQDQARAVESRTDAAARAHSAHAPQPIAAHAHGGAAGVDLEAPLADRRNEAALSTPEAQPSDIPQPERASSTQPANAEQPADASSQRAATTQRSSTPPTIGARVPFERPVSAQSLDASAQAASSAQRGDSRRANEPADAAARLTPPAQRHDTHPEAIAQAAPPTLDTPPTAAEPTSVSKSSASSQRSRVRAKSSGGREEPIELARATEASATTPLPAAPATTDALGTQLAAAPATTNALGTLRINSRPWSQVFLDGRLIGTTPQMGVRVPAGRYTVRLANPELSMSKTFIVHVAEGELVTRIVSLE